MYAHHNHHHHCFPYRAISSNLLASFWFHFSTFSFSFFLSSSVYSHQIEWKDSLCVKIRHGVSIHFFSVSTQILKSKHNKSHSLFFFIYILTWFLTFIFIFFILVAPTNFIRCLLLFLYRYIFLWLASFA